VCIEVTVEFLAFSKARGNDLSTPQPDFDFPGLKPGDRWCLCAARWREALEAGSPPRVILEATHEDTLEIVEPGPALRHRSRLSRRSSPSVGRPLTTRVAQAPLKRRGAR
jgi:uncharacterized protein (DUF2237 family)